MKRSLELADADPAEVGVRLRVAGGQVRPRFTNEPEPDDAVVEQGGVRIFIAASVLASGGDVEIDVTDEHEQLVVRPLR